MVLCDGVDDDKGKATEVADCVTNDVIISTDGFSSLLTYICVLNFIKLGNIVIW